MVMLYPCKDKHPLMVVQKQLFVPVPTKLSKDIHATKTTKENIFNVRTYFQQVSLLEGGKNNYNM
jgi:hypothetical protein